MVVEWFQGLIMNLLLFWRSMYIGRIDEVVGYQSYLYFGSHLEESKPSSLLNVGLLDLKYCMNW